MRASLPLSLALAAALTAGLAACAPAPAPADSPAPEISAHAVMDREATLQMVTDMLVGGFDVVQDGDLVVGYYDGERVIEFIGELAPVLEEATAAAERLGVDGELAPLPREDVVESLAWFIKDGLDLVQEGDDIAVYSGTDIVATIPGDLASLIDEATALAATL